LVVGSEEEVGSRSFLKNDKFGVTYFSKVSFTLEKLRSDYSGQCKQISGQYGNER